MMLLEQMVCGVTGPGIGKAGAGREIAREGVHVRLFEAV